MGWKPVLRSGRQSWQLVIFDAFGSFADGLETRLAIYFQKLLLTRIVGLWYIPRPFRSLFLSALAVRTRCAEKNMRRTTLLAWAALLGFGIATIGFAEPIPSATTRSEAQRYDAVGRLMLNHADQGKASPPFLLVDSSGKPRCYVTPGEGVGLTEFVNLRVGLRGSVKPIEGATLPHIVVRGVRQVADPAAVASAKQAEPQSEVAAAGYAEPAQHEELPTPAPVADPNFSGEGQIMEGPVVDGMQPGPMQFDDGGYQGPGGCATGLCGHASCPGVGCPACKVCCNANDYGTWWVRAEYLQWATSGMYIPPLATTGPDANNPGILGEQGTQILFGDQRINDGMRSGGRISFGRWLDCDQRWGISGEYFGLEDESTNFYAASDANGSPIISRPYFTVFGFDSNGDPKPAQENAELVSLPDVLSGSLEVNTNTSFQGAGALLRHNFCCKNVCWPDCCVCDPCNNSCGVPGGIRVGALVGYRFYRLRDSVSITERLTSLSDDNPGSFHINDNFKTSNQFNGAEVGFVMDARKARWTLELMGKIAVGSNRQTVNINGQTTITGSDADDGTYPGGLLALNGTNIGNYSRNKFNVIPQLNMNLGYNLTPRLRAIVGYTLIYWSSVARAGDQISLDVNETYLPRAFDNPSGPARPAFAWRDTDFWAQGINVGLDYRF
jgi:hypothetical protein